MVISMIVAMVNMFKQDDKIEHLTRVEWLYRWSRIGRTDTEDYQDFERRMLFGKKEEREGMKTKIFNLERNAPQFLYFNPTDDRNQIHPSLSLRSNKRSKPLNLRIAVRNSLNKNRI